MSYKNRLIPVEPMPPSRRRNPKYKAGSPSWGTKQKAAWKKRRRLG